MSFIADLHIHSHFSIATSKQLMPEFLDYWAKLKGIKVVGTGDFTHPRWVAELKEKLEPAEEGLFRLKKDFIKPLPHNNYTEDVRFMLTAEISNVYKKHGKVRKVHNVVMSPSFEVVEKIQAKLSAMGFNITSDGRPILGLDSRDLLEICLEASEDIFFVPAHIWTPWFSALGSKSGFDSIKECYGDLAGNIFAVETGLSTDPAMNRLISSLDEYTLLSNSDAHSPEKLGRNANIFDPGLNYPGIIDAMKSGDPRKFLGTIDFFPEEGKYHYDGHRKCNVCWNPLETLKHNEICPVCGKKVTEGVLNRVAQLANRDDISAQLKNHPFYSLIPLKELLAEIEGVGPASKKIEKQYMNILSKAGSEFNLLLHYDIDKVKSITGEMLAEAIRRMRNREVFIKEGFDGEFGVIKVFGDGESPQSLHQENLFVNDMQTEYKSEVKTRPLISFDIAEFQKLKKEKTLAKKESGTGIVPDLFSQNTIVTSELNTEQKAAVEHLNGPALVLAGPGTGKTKVLTNRIANLILNRNVKPETLLAVTFTNKAATEMRSRLNSLLRNEDIAAKPNISTFHSFGLSLLEKHFEKTGRKKNFTVVDEDEKRKILKYLGIEKNRLNSASRFISEAKMTKIDIRESGFTDFFEKYENFLIDINAYDFDDLIRWPVILLKENRNTRGNFANNIKWLLVDEYQDINALQYEMIKLLVPGENPNIFVIGDPNQAIYGFRGADIGFIENFRTDYPRAKVFGLTKSYRCSDSILRASGSIIEKDDGFLKGLREGVKITISENPTDKSEAEFIARTVERMIGGVGFFSMDSSITTGHKEKEIESLADFAVLVRTGKQMKVLEKAFKDHNIPYVKVGDEPFFKREPAKSILDILKIAYMQNNTGLKYFGTEKLPEEIDSEFLKKELEDKTVKEQIEYINKNYFGQEREDGSLIINALKNLAGKYGADTGKFLKEMALGSPVDMWNRGTEAVNLMTLHSSKGLEFKCVFIAGCEKGLIPYSLFEDKKADAEEERRLLYVGMTRAKTHLFLTYAKKRFIMGKRLNSGRSHFLDNIEKELTEQAEQQYKKRLKKDDGQLELF